MNKVIAGARRVLVAMASGGVENVNGLVVLAGACWLYVGIAGFSRHAADVVAGVIVIVIGAFPYVMRMRKRKS